MISTRSKIRLSNFESVAESVATDLIENEKTPAMRLIVGQVEKAVVSAAMRAEDHCMSRAAIRIGINRSTLKKIIEQHNLHFPTYKRAESK